MKTLKVNTAGASAPVFLCGDRHRFYLENYSNSEVTLQLSYEHKGGKPIWLTYPVGKLNSDFAFEEFGVSAVRLRVANTEKRNVDVELIVHNVGC